MGASDDCRIWLRNNGYDDVAELIDRVMVDWRSRGVRTRRNWWNVLAGTKHGRSISVSGVSFPMLRAARIRAGYDPTPLDVCRNESELAPDIRIQMRWQKQKKQ